ncbi:MAG: SH3 domain-containing protein [Proteobacteria bacterium]|nr:SH3 domain-containing protein [Pseudomonadota bacterium]
MLWSLVGCAALVGCLGKISSSSDAMSSESPTHLKSLTLLPTSFSSKLSAEPVAKAEVPPQMLLISQVVRPHAEMRVGPGTQYELLDATLDRGADAIVLAQHGVWLKILPVISGASGWVHRQALSRPRLNVQPFSLSLQRLPTIQVVHDTNLVWDFPSSKQWHVMIPRGAMFRQLRLNGNGALVWLPETNSVMWLSRKDVL